MASFLFWRSSGRFTQGPVPGYVPPMKPGHASKTAVLVCAGRAAAHGTNWVPRFSDPTAFALLPSDAQRRVERHRKTGPRGMMATIFEARAKAMAVRTVFIDDA